ncbi:MAG: glycine cleavage system protein H [Acidobacteria bacterium]|nr:glycine cleavage system protein H [Acidobacteriota bacterium]
METSGYVDIFATKGMEYLFLLGFGFVLVFFWRFLSGTGEPEIPRKEKGAPRARHMRRVVLPSELYYHRGHGWVAPDHSDTARVGIDDFVQKLIGRARFIDLPRVGTFLKQGEKGWKLESDSLSVDVLSPVDGEVLAVNEEALRNPQVVNQEPYGNGWLLEVRAPRIKSNQAHLLSGELAAAWMKKTEEDFNRRMSDDPDLVGKIGREAGDETAVAVPREKWNDLVQEFLLNG